MAISPAVASRTFTPKFFIVLVLAGAGLVPFVGSLRHSTGTRRVALFGALGFIVIALASALLSGAPNLGLFGLYGWGTGWLMWLGCAGAFGIGSQLREGDDRWLFGGLLTGAIANSLFALYQVLAQPSSGTFGAYQGTQADGFLGNPIFLESFLLGVIALVAIRSVKSSLRSYAFLGWSACLMLMASALELTKERAAVGLLALLFVGLLLRYRAKGLLVAALATLGYGSGYLGAGRGLGARLAQGTSSVGFHQRLSIWKLALSALPHHLLLGYGPGQLEAATNPRMSLSLARTLEAGKLFVDAHNIVIEVLVTTGVIGFLCLAAWVVGAVASARNTFVLFAVMCLAVELVEPLNIAITPLIFLTLGAATVSRASVPRDSLQPFRLAGRVTVAVLCSAGILLGGEMLAGDVALNNAPPHRFSLASSRQANSLLFYWPDSSAALVECYRYEAAITHGRRARQHYLDLALTYSRETAGRLPPDPLAWVSLGDSELALGHFAAARIEYHRALQAERWSIAALDGLGQSYIEQHRFGSAEYWYRRELEVLPPGPGRAGVRRALKDAEDGIVPQGGI